MARLLVIVACAPVTRRIVYRVKKQKIEIHTIAVGMRRDDEVYVEGV